MSDFQSFKTSGGDPVSVLAVGDGVAYVAHDDGDKLNPAHDAILGGADPATAMPADAVRIERGRLREVRHDRGSDSIEIVYGTDGGGSTYQVFAPAEGESGDAVGAVVRAMGLGPTPRSRPATVVEASIGPAVLTAIPAIVLAVGLGLAAIVDPDDGTTRLGRAGLIKRIVGLLGTTGFAVLLALTLVIGGAYWAYCILNRPTIDVYTPPGPSREG